MIFPLDFLDLSLFFAVLALILLSASSVLSGSKRKNVLVNTRKLKKAALVVALLFLITVTLRLVSEIILG
jgi:hypothetical protein